MLTPEQMDGAGELTAAVYRQIEADLVAYLVRKMIEGDVSGQRAQTALGLVAQTMPLELKRAIDAHSREIDRAVREDVERALSASDAWDLAAISEGLGVQLASDALTAQTLSVAASVRGVIARDNVEMNAAARRQYMKWTDWAATQVATGNMTADRAKHVAVRKLAGEGLSIEWIQYRDPDTGKRTVRARADVAVQRHIRTLIAQGAAQLTMRRCAESGCGFVEVSSHIGARPSHAEWHGRCYHLGGAVEVDGVRYEDFHEGTGYEGLRGPYTDLGDQLLGVNCRHSFAPWMPGMPRAYSPDPEHPSGLSNDEVYELTQKQRAIERDIRDKKREQAAAQQAYDADPTTENQVELAKAKRALRHQQERMREFIKESNAKCRPGTEVLVRQPQREWAGDMPKGRLQPPAPANRTLDQFMSMPSVKQQIKAAGLSQDAVRRQIAQGLADDNVATQGFRWNTVRQQGERLTDAIANLRSSIDGSVKATKGAHAQVQPTDDLHPRRVAGVIRTKESMTFDQADGSRANPNYNPKRIGPHEKNCQASVLAHEARRRGYDVQAKGYDKDSAAMLALAAEPNIAYHDPGNAAAVARKIKPADAPTFARFHKMCEETVRQGERYQMRFTDGSMGHVVCLDRSDAGELRIHDPQSGETHVGARAREYLKRIKYRSKSYGMDVYEDNYIYRVDDKALNSKIADEVLEPRQ